MFGFGKKERKRPLLLNIDDQEIAYVLALGVAAQLGCDMEYANGGKLGIEMASKLQPDCILLDYAMPEMDGPTTCTLLKQNEQTRHIPVVMLTAVDTVKDIDRAIEAGAAGYVVKPISAERLLPKIEAFIRKK